MSNLANVKGPLGYEMRLGLHSQTPSNRAQQYIKLSQLRMQNHVSYDMLG